MMALNYSFAGKRILITGGTRGIGRGMVKFFHDDGAIVFTIGKNPENVEKLKEEFPRVTAVTADLWNWQETRAVVQSLGPIDFLVNNAGLVIPQSFMNVTEDSAKAQLNTNVLGLINVSQVVAKGMIERGTGGVIVNIGSVDARKYINDAAVYSSSKAAVESLTRTMAKELGPHNIRVNCIVLGLVDGGMVDVELLGKELFEVCEKAKNSCIVKRYVEMGEVAQLTMSPLSSMMVGENYVLDGGYLNA